MCLYYLYVVAAVVSENTDLTMSLKLKAPERLPVDGVTTVAFKAWKNNLFSFLEQDTDNYLFLEGGHYATWTAQADSADRKRIAELHAADPEALKLRRKLNNPQAGYNQEDLDEDRRVLLLRRNAQLSKFIQLICVVCHYTEHDDISALSTTAAWIIQYLEQHYNLEKKGAHFLKVSELHYKQDTNHQTFYREFRSAIYDNLKKRGHQIKYLNDKNLEADETMSPTFEETIVLWCLEKIDSRLPMHVNKTFGHQMTGNMTLKDLQIQIFQRISSMIQDLNDVENNRSATLNFLEQQDDPTEAQLAAFRTQQNRSRYQRPSNSSQRTNFARKAFCNICKIAGRPTAIAESHNAANCRLKNAILNAASVNEELQDEQVIPFSDSLQEEELVQ